MQDFDGGGVKIFCTNVGHYMPGHEEPEQRIYLPFPELKLSSLTLSVPGFANPTDLLHIYMYMPMVMRGLIVATFLKI